MYGVLLGRTQRAGLVLPFKSPPDCADENAEVPKIALHRVNATEEPSQGMVFPNPVDQGVGGTLTAVPQMHGYRGKPWTLVGFGSGGSQVRPPNLLRVSRH